jgi:predicted nucleotidyltransferase
MDRTERAFKISLELCLAAWAYVLASRVPIQRRHRLGLALLIAHTANLLANGHLRAAMKWHGHSYDPDVRDRSITAIARRLARLGSVQDVFIYGSLSRGDFGPSSDLDLRVLRTPGAMNGIAACGAVAAERFRAMVTGVPLDIFVWDSPSRAQSMRQDEQLARLADWCREHIHDC